MFSRIIFVAATLAAAPALAQSGSYQIPWRDIPAHRCSIHFEPNVVGRLIVLRCKGHIDVVVAVCSADGCL